MSLFDSYWIKFPWWSIRKATYLIWLSLLGTVVIGFIALTLYIKSLPSLSTWHTTVLQNEFTVHSEVKDYDAYVALEKKLFQELDSEVYDKVLNTEQNSVNRYTKNSFSDPKRWSKAWNKSFELPVKDPKMGVLLLHGMSDSPYSLHAQAEYLQKQGVWVVAMRMPGHGTIPSGLTEITWKDMAAVVKIGMKRLTQKLGDKPIHIMGYSTGAPLALNYTFSALKDSTLTLPSSLIFYSPAIGVSKAAPLAIWQSRIGHFLSLPKLEWNSIAPEYDPFKYNSFAVNAGDQVYRICKKVQEQFDDYHKETEHTKDFPPVLSFQSIIDNTVSVTDTVNYLYKRLPKGDHALVLFDINNHFSNNLLVKRKVTDTIQNLKQNSGGSNYQFDLISNMNSTNGSLELIRDNTAVKKLPYTWPKRLFSLSHLAMPIAKNDPLYGDKNTAKSPGIKLGHLAMYGESSVLEISPSAILRQRWNPFHTYTRKRVLEFLGL
jgi:esterase/lipase